MNPHTVYGILIFSVLSIFWWNNLPKTKVTGKLKVLIGKKPSARHVPIDELEDKVKRGSHKEL